MRPTVHRQDQRIFLRWLKTSRMQHPTLNFGSVKRFVPDLLCFRQSAATEIFRVRIGHNGWLRIGLGPEPHNRSRLIRFFVYRGGLAGIRQGKAAVVMRSASNLALSTVEFRGIYI